MKADEVIVVEDLTKSFRIQQAGTGSLKAAILEKLAGASQPHRILNALDHISFSVKQGETLGIIGANGAGKSTLLSVLTGTLTPTSGSVRTRGAISSLLELGAGFHPELTGRENVYLYGAIMGISRRQMRERFDSIVAFAELDSFIDQPVKHYSSGMYVRLGFAVAVEVDPDILLIDEVLAVGDIVFQRKCIEKMHAFRQSGKTLVIISHDIPTIQSISNRILFLDSGKIIGLGDPEAVAGEYQALSRRRWAQGQAREWGTGEAKITKVDFLNADGVSTDTFQWGDSLKLRIHYHASTRIENPVFGFALADHHGHLVYGNNTQIEGVKLPYIQGEGVLALELDKLNMAQGAYLFSFSIHSADHKKNYHRLDHQYSIHLKSTKSFEGICHMPCRWIPESHEGA